MNREYFEKMFVLIAITDAIFMYYSRKFYFTIRCFLIFHIGFTYTGRMSGTLILYELDWAFLESEN